MRQIAEFGPVVQILDLPLEQSILQSISEAHVVERASRVPVPLMVFPLADVPKISLLQY